MAYGTRWKIETINPYNSHEVEVFIKERDYAGAVTDLPPGGDMVAIRYTPIGMFSGTPHWTLAASEATIEFIDDGTGQLSDVLSGDDEKYLVVVQDSNADMWQGYLIPDSYGYVPYNRSNARVTATDRLGTLFSSAYLQSTGYVYSGRQNIIEIIANCVQKISTALPFATHMRWYPYIGTNDLDTNDNPLEHLFLDNEIFYDDDDNPMSCGYVLEQICGRFQMHLFQDVARWQLHQRRKTVASNLFTVFLYDSDGSPSVTTTTTYQAYTEIEGTTNRLASPYMTGSVPYGSVSVVYNHGNPFTDLFANRSFEKVLHGTVTGTPLANSVTAQTGTSLVIDGLTAGISIPAGMKFSITGQDAEYELAAAVTADGSGNATLTLTFGLVSSVANNTAITFLEDVGNWQYDNVGGDFAGIPTASDGAIGMELSVDFETSPFSYLAANFLRQRSREQVAGGSGYRITGGWDVNVPNLDDVSTELYMAFRAYIDVSGTPYYYKWSDSTWTTTNTKNEVPLKSYDLGNNTFNRFTFTTGELDDTGTPLTGYFYFEFLEGHELNSGGSATTGLSIIIDNFQQPVLIDANYLPAGEATQTTITYDGNVNRSKPDVPQFIIGDGPTTAHVRRLTLKDSTLAETGDITGDWVYGPATSASGVTLDQFWADEILKQYRRSARRLSTGVFSMAASGIVSPRHMLRITNPNNTNTPDYFWMDLEWRPAAYQNVVSGTFVEYVEGAGGNLLCEYSVPGASVAALSLTLEQGIPCATGGTAIAPSVPAGTLFFTVGTSSNSEITASSVTRRDPDGTIVTLKTFVGTAPTGICLDPIERWVFCVQGQNIWRMRFDGTESSNIFTHSGNTVYGIDFMPTGTYAGYLFYATGTTGTENEDIYRVDRDGNNDALVSTGNSFTGAGPSVVVANSTTIYTNTTYINALVISYPAAGGSYSVVNADAGSSADGIALDASGGRIFNSDSAFLEVYSPVGDTTETTYTSVNNGGQIWWDATGDRLWTPGNAGGGLRYRADGALSTEVLVSPLTATGGNYSVNQIIAVQ